MELRTQKNGNTAEVAITGEMNIYNALELKAALVTAVDGAEAVELDLSGVSEFDSSGAQLLLLARKECELAGKKLTLAARSAPVDSVIGLFNLAELFGSARQGEA
jgi:anti-anti-sigma factor